MEQGDKMTDSDGSLNTNAQLFEQPYRDLCAGLKELENVVDWRQQHLSTSSASASLHLVWGFGVLWRVEIASRSWPYCVLQCDGVEANGVREMIMAMNRMRQRLGRCCSKSDPDEAVAQRTD